MRNGEIKVYKGCTIRKVSGDEFVVGGFMNRFDSYRKAKEAVDAAAEEEKAMTDAEQYVQSVCGGWM